MAVEAALVKPVVDVLLGLFQQGKDLKLKRNAEAAIREAIRELLLANPNENKAAARIAVARAAGILGEEVALAEDMLRRHRATKSRTASKSRVGKARKTSDKPAQKTARGALDKQHAREAAPVSKAATASATRKATKPRA